MPFIWDEDVQNGLIDFLSDKTVIFQGTIGRWNGNFPGGEIGDFDTLLYEFIKDCDYIHIYDDKETSVHIAKIYTMCGQLYVEDTYKVVKVTDMQEAVKQFNYIVTIAVDNISFLLEGV